MFYYYYYYSQKNPKYLQDHFLYHHFLIIDLATFLTKENIIFMRERQFNRKNLDPTSSLITYITNFCHKFVCLLLFAAGTTHLLYNARLSIII